MVSQYTRKTIILFTYNKYYAFPPEIDGASTARSLVEEKGAP